MKLPPPIWEDVREWFQVEQRLRNPDKPRQNALRPHGRRGCRALRPHGGIR